MKKTSTSIRATTRKQTNNNHQQEGPTPKHFRQQINIFFLKIREPIKLRLGQNEMI